MSFYSKLANILIDVSHLGASAPPNRPFSLIYILLSMYTYIHILSSFFTTLYGCQVGGHRRLWRACREMRAQTWLFPSVGQPNWPLFVHKYIYIYINPIRSHFLDSSLSHSLLHHICLFLNLFLPAIYYPRKHIIPHPNHPMYNVINSSKSLGIYILINCIHIHMYACVCMLYICVSRREVVITVTTKDTCIYKRKSFG